MNTARVKAINGILQFLTIQILLQGCSSNTGTPLDVKPLSLSESPEKLSFNVVFVHADDLDEFSFSYKYLGAAENSENLFIDKILYEGDSQEERSYRYPGDTALGSFSTGNMLKRNAETVFRSIFNNAPTLYIPGDDHFEGIVLDHQPYKEMVPPDTAAIIKLKSPEVRFFLDCKKPELSFGSCDLLAELAAEWVLEDLEGNTIWSSTIVGSGRYDYGLLDSFKTLVQKPFQPAADDHFRNLVHAIERSPEIRLFESCLQIGCDSLLANPSSVRERLGSIQNTQERKQIAHRLVYMAIEKGNRDLLNELLSLDYIDINSADKYYQKLPIHLAVQKNNLEATELLITHGSTINTADKNGFTPLHYAASNGHTKITRLLIQKGTDVNARNSEGQTPFVLAIRNGHENDWQLLLDSGAAHDAIDESDPLLTGELYNSIGLYLAIKDDKVESTETLRIASRYFEKASLLYGRAAKRAENVAFLKDLFEFTLLTAHAWGSQWQARQTAKQYAELRALNDAREMGLSQTQTLALIRDYKSNALNSDVTLTAARPNPSATSSSSITPASPNVAKTATVRKIGEYYSQLSEICHKSSNEVESILECYEKRGGQFKECIPVKYVQNHLVQASKNGNVQAVETLLSSKVGVSARDKNGSTALWTASYGGHTEIVSLLLEKGADVNVKGADGVTPLWIASQNGHTDVVRLLLEKSADLDVVRTTDGVTALWQASNNGHIEVVKLLLENGADADVKRREDGVTALWQASWKGYTQIVTLLLNKGADVHVKRTTNGFTALSVASHGGHTAVVQLLLEKGADVNATNNAGLTPLDLAQEKGHSQIVELLKKHGAKE